MEKKDQYLTIAQAAEFLNVSKTSLRRWTNKKALKCYRIGSRNERRFLVDDLIAFMPASVPDQQSATTKSHGHTKRRGHHGHVSTQYSSLEDQWSLIRQHFLAHLDDDSRIVYLYDQSKSHIGTWLNDEGIDPGLVQAAGTLRLVPASESYLKDGFFDTARMLDFWDRVISAAARDGIKQLLLSGEMAWSTRGAPGSDELIDYEAALDEILAPYPWVTIVCQYDLRAFPADILFRSLCTHPGVQLPNTVVPGLR